MLTAKECLHRAQAQFPFAFACLGARCLSGDMAVFQEWTQRFWANLFKNQMAFLSEMADYLEALHEDNGSSVYLTESDLKLGAGGLVDLAGLHGCLTVMTGSNDPLMRPVSGSLAPRDWQRLEEARRHLILVRNHLHFMEGRRQDRLLCDHFPQVAEFLAGSTSEPEVAAGFLVRETVRRRRNVHQIVTRFLRRAKHDVNASVRQGQGPLSEAHCTCLHGSLGREGGFGNA